MKPAKMREFAGELHPENIEDTVNVFKQKNTWYDSPKLGYSLTHESYFRNVVQNGLFGC
jgi:hypothetical protein